MRLATAFAITLSLVACGSPEPPIIPPEPTPPPAVTTEGAVAIRLSRDLPTDLEATRALLRSDPLIDQLREVDGIAPPVSARTLSGTWGEPGAVRRLTLADGHYVIERVLENEPRRFRYQVWVFTNAAGQGVEQIVGEQRFLPLPDGGTRFEWDYDIVPAGPVAGFFIARRASTIETYLSGGLERFAALTAGG